MKLLNSLLVSVIFLLPSFLLAQESWTRITPSPQEHTLNFIYKIPGTERLIAIGEGSTIMISEDTGNTWDIELNPAGMENDYVCKGLCFINETTGFIYGGRETILKTVDGGLTWSLKFISNTIYNWQCINEIAFVDETTGFAVGDEGRFLKTTDAGETWLPLAVGNGFYLNQIEFANTMTGFITANSDSLILKTIDGGATWSWIPYPVGYHGCSEMCFINDSVGFAFNNEYDPDHTGNIFRTADAGLTWSEVYSDPSIYLGKFAFFDDLNGILGCVSWNYSSKIITTADGGISWSGAWPPGMPWYATNSLCSTDPNTAFSVGAYGMIYKTTNKGLDWEAAYNRSFMGDIFDAQFVTPDDGFTFSQQWGGGLSNSVVKKTNDGGETWQAIDGGMVDRGVLDFISRDTGFVAFNCFDLVVHKTLDGGSHWKEYVTGYNFDPVDMKFFDANNGMIAGDGQLLITHDSGETWEITNTGITSGFHFSYKIASRSASNIFVAAEIYDTTALLITDDGGLSWQRHNLGIYGPPKDICLSGNQEIFIACNNNILKSTDDGNTWIVSATNNSNPIEFRSIFFPSEDTGYVAGAGTFENMMKTTDGGENWFVINSGLTSDLNYVYFANDYRGLVFGDWGVESGTTDGGIIGLQEQVSGTAADCFEISPNPVPELLEIQLNTTLQNYKSELIISDLKGTELKKLKIAEHQASIKVPMENFKPGFYLIQILSETCKCDSRKIVKL